MAMINSVAAICSAVRTSLAEQVLPQVQDAYARGQLAAAIYALANLERQAGWSHAVQEALKKESESGIDEAYAALEALGESPPARAQAHSGRPEELRAASDETACALFDWLELRTRTAQDPQPFDRIARQLLQRATQVSIQEKRMVAPSMMQELSGG
jgi:hypothetical protein